MQILHAYTSASPQHNDNGLAATKVVMPTTSPVLVSPCSPCLCAPVQLVLLIPRSAIPMDWLKIVVLALEPWPVVLLAVEPIIHGFIMWSCCLSWWSFGHHNLLIVVILLFFHVFT